MDAGAVVEAPPAPRAGDQWSEALRASTYITGEPSFVGEFYQRLRDINRKFAIKGYNWPYDIRVGDMMESELTDVVYTVAGLVPWVDREKVLAELDASMEQMRKGDVMLRIPHLRFTLSSWIYRTRLGLPPMVDRSEFDLDVRQVFAEHHALVQATDAELRQARARARRMVKR